MSIGALRRPAVGLLLLIVLGMTALAAAPARACPMCADNLPSANSNTTGGPTADASLGRPGQPALQSPALAEGFYYSILLMVFVPYLVLGGLGYYIWRLVQAADKGVINQPAAAAAME